MGIHILVLLSENTSFTYLQHILAVILIHLSLIFMDGPGQLKAIYGTQSGILLERNLASLLLFQTVFQMWRQVQGLGILLRNMMKTMDGVVIPTGKNMELGNVMTPVLSGVIRTMAVQLVQLATTT